MSTCHPAEEQPFGKEWVGPGDYTWDVAVSPNSETGCYTDERELSSLPPLEPRKVIRFALRNSLILLTAPFPEEDGRWEDHLADQEILDFYIEARRGVSGLIADGL